MTYVNLLRVKQVVVGKRTITLAGLTALEREIVAASLPPRPPKPRHPWKGPR